MIDIEKYKKLKLIDDSTNIIELESEEDLDYDNVVGMHLISSKYDNYLSFTKKGDKDDEYSQYLENILDDFEDLFIFSDVTNGRIYFECLVSSKTNSKVKFLKTVLISKVNSDECPKCKSQLKIKPLGTRTLYIDGHLEKCSKYSIYCSNCDGLFGTSGFKMIQFMKDFIRSPGSYLKSANVKAYENEVGIEFATNLSENHRCK